MECDEGIEELGECISLETVTDHDENLVITQVMDGNACPQESSSSRCRGRSKIYKQFYRKAWEKMPEFKDWLCGVPGEKSKAYCKFCERSLHAHRLSLIKHTVSMKHTKMAVRKAGVKELTQRVVQPAPQPKASLSTQVTDLGNGRPVSGLQVSLHRLCSGRWVLVSEATTGQDGTTAFLPIGPDRYRLHYETQHYFLMRHLSSFYPYVDIIFDLPPDTDTHIPLLIGPYTYTTFRGG